MESVSPASGEVILVNAEDKTPAFNAVVKYSLDSLPAGDIVLQLFDQSGTLLATSTPVAVKEGSGTAGRATGCQGPNIANGCLTLPPTGYDKAESVTLAALLRDSKGNPLAQSSPRITYRIVTPKVTLTLGSLPPFGEGAGTFTPAPADTTIEGGSSIEYIDQCRRYPGVL